MEISVLYNSGAEREGTLTIHFNGKEYPVAIRQAACNFGYGKAEFFGSVVAGEATKAYIELSYVNASGEEKAEIGGRVSEDIGITIQPFTYDRFSAGDGKIEIPLSGIARGSGSLTFTVTVDGVDVAECSTTVIADPDAPQGLPVGWNYFLSKDELDNVTTFLQGSRYDYSWSTEASGVQLGPDAKSTEHKLLPNIGNREAYMTIQRSDASGVYGLSKDVPSYSIRVNKVAVDDYLLFVIPVKNIKSTTKVFVEGAFGAAGKGPGCWALEYSSDGSRWTLAPGAEDVSWNDVAGKAHFRVPNGNDVPGGIGDRNGDGLISNSTSSSSDLSTGKYRNIYQKDIDDGYYTYTFPLEGITDIAEGTLYFRLRVSVNLRASYGSAYVIDGGYGDLKGFEISLAE